VVCCMGMHSKSTDHPIKSQSPNAPPQTGAWTEKGP
jgi:hypothetical protein